MSLRSLIVNFFILGSLFLVTLSTETKAIDELACRQKCKLESGGNTTNINANVDAVPYKLTRNGADISINITFDEEVNGSICATFDRYNDDPDESFSTPPEILDCKSTFVNGTSISVSLPHPTSAGYYGSRLIRDSGYHAAISEVYDYVESGGTVIPTPSPTPICIGRDDTFMQSGTCCDPDEYERSKTSGGVGFCEGYRCQPIPSSLADNKDIVCNKDGEGGWVEPIVYEPDNDEIKKAIEQASQSCGYSGQQCCVPRVLPPPQVDNWMTRYILNPLQNWIFDLAGINSVTKDIEADINSVTDGTLCKQTGTVPELTYTDEKKQIVDNIYFAGNEKEAEESHYQFTPLQINSYDQCIQGGGNEDQCSRQSLTPTIIPMTPTIIPEKSVKVCTCTPIEGQEIDQYASETANPTNISTTELEQQICEGNSPCLGCIRTPGQFWQPWLDAGSQCVGEAAAVNNLDQFVGESPPQTKADNTVARVNNEPAVLGIRELQQYVAGCDTLPQETTINLCKACRLSGQFWGSWGCSPKYVDVGHILNLCRTLNGKEYNDCRLCASSGRMWTAIGCVDFNIQGIIQEQVFGWGIGLAGISAILCIIYSAFILQTSANNPERIKQAQDTMTACITGLVVIIFSVFILNVIGVDILRIPGFQRESPSATTTESVTPPSTVGAGTAAPTAPVVTPALPTAVSLPLDSPTPVAPTSPLGTPSPIPTTNLTGTPTAVPTLLAPTKPLPTPTPTRSPALAEHDCEPREKPPDDEVYLYSDVNYGGKCLRLKVGDYGNLQSVNNSSTKGGANWGGECNGSYNDCIDSIKVGRAVAATIYQNPGGEGSLLRNWGCSIKFNYDVDDFTDFDKNGCENDSISAVKVAKE